ncbi:olfactory receptor 6N1-like [Engystomops pustulosus]|uniref:olfactory receptor 6N1-like n=1 Tax=Engystomops pustulosus TaxID=76066 RepID=UPI003AFA3A5F
MGPVAAIIIAGPITLIVCCKWTNWTVITEFFLLGFQGSRFYRNLLFLQFLVVFDATICGNLLIILLVSTSKNLHTPMYFFISQLSISDILLTTNIVPKLFHILLNNGGTISFADCFTQFYFFATSEAVECLLLTVMSFDRYVAICNPLRYNSIVTNDLCVRLIAMCWLGGFSASFVMTITPSQFHYCGANIIDHFFCDLLPVLELSCSDTIMIIMHKEMYIISFPTIIIPTTIIIVSYTHIVITILRIPTSTGRQKAFSTCSSHLIVVSIFYWSMFSVYIVPAKGQSSTMNKIISLLFTVFTPFINPIVYSLRNKDLKKALQKALNKMC